MRSGMKGQTSYEVITTYVKESDEYVDVTEVFSERCLIHWLDTRKKKVKHPYDSFRRAVLAHLGGRDGRKKYPTRLEHAFYCYMAGIDSPWRFLRTHSKSCTGDTGSPPGRSIYLNPEFVFMRQDICHFVPTRPFSELSVANWSNQFLYHSKDLLDDVGLFVGEEMGNGFYSIQEYQQVQDILETCRQHNLKQVWIRQCVRQRPGFYRVCISLATLEKHVTRYQTQFVCEPFRRD